MPQDQKDRISDKLMDLLYCILVPNPADRPTVEKLLHLLVNWNKVTSITLSNAAHQIKQKNMDRAS